MKKKKRTVSSSEWDAVLLSRSSSGESLDYSLEGQQNVLESKSRLLKSGTSH